MTDLFNAPFFKLLEILKKYVHAVKSNDVLELNQLKQEHSELFTEEFRLYLREWLGIFGISEEFLNSLNDEGHRPLKVDEVTTFHLKEMTHT